MILSEGVEFTTIQSAIEGYIVAGAQEGISLRMKRDFHKYAAVRRANGDAHLNQAFDPKFSRFTHRDFWIVAENAQEEPVATYCVRHLAVENFYSLILSQMLWFGRRPRPVDGTFDFECEIPPFGGHVAHGGGLWVRGDYRGWSKLATILPHLGRAIALRNWPLDHDTGMIRDDPGESPKIIARKASFMGTRIYGFARVCRFVSGWFPPEARHAIMHLCHSTRIEAVASLAQPRPRVVLTAMASRTLDRARLSTREDGLRVDRRWRTEGAA
jgi:hypothetical protein